MVDKIISCITSVIAMLSLAFIEYQMILKGIDGVIASLIVLAISGLGGFNLARYYYKKNGKN